MIINKNLQVIGLLFFLIEPTFTPLLNPVSKVNPEHLLSIEVQSSSFNTIESEKTSSNKEYFLIDNQEGKLEVFDGTTFQFIKEISYICTYAISGNSNLIAKADYQENNRFASIASFPDGKDVVKIPFFQELSSNFFCSQHIAISSTGKYVAMAAPTGDIEVANTQDKNIINQFSIGDSGITDIKFSPDENYVAVVNVDADLIVWNIKTNSSVFTYNDPSKNLLFVEFSPDSKELVINNNQQTSNLVFFSVRSGKRIGDYTLEGATGSLQVTENNTIIVDDEYNVREISWLTKTDTGRYANCTKSPDHEDFLDTDVYDSSLSSDGKRVAISCNYFNTNQKQIIVRNFDTGEINYEFDYAPLEGEAIPLVTFIN